MRQKDGDAFVPLRGTTEGKQKKSTVAFSYGGQGWVGPVGTRLHRVGLWGGGVATKEAQRSTKMHKEVGWLCADEQDDFGSSVARWSLPAVATECEGGSKARLCVESARNCPCAGTECFLWAFYASAAGLSTS